LRLVLLGGSGLSSNELSSVSVMVSQMESKLL
jgi:hypothetical protein